jgi:hypothetical protein
MHHIHEKSFPNPNQIRILLASKALQRHRPCGSRSTLSSYTFRAKALIADTTAMADQLQSPQSVSSTAVSFASIGVKHTTINEASGVSLNPQKKLAVGSVLDVRNSNMSP